MIVSAYEFSTIVGTGADDCTTGVGDAGVELHAADTTSIVAEQTQLSA